MRAWVLGIGALAGCASVKVDSTELPLEEFPPAARARVDEVLSDLAVVVPIEATEVKSRPEVYDFLLSEMPFTGGVVRELGRGDWDIFRDRKNPDKNVFYVIDPEGFQLRFELIHGDATRRYYLSRGVFQVGFLAQLKGQTLVVMTAAPRGDYIRTEAKVYVRVEGGLWAGLAKGSRDMLADKVREKTSYFIKASKWVAEEVASRPEWLYNQLHGSKHVDAGVLEEFRRKFLVR